MKNKKILGIIIAIIGVVAVFSGGMALSENLVLREDVQTTVSDNSEVFADDKGNSVVVTDADAKKPSENPEDYIHHNNGETTKKSDAAGIPDTPTKPNNTGKKFVLNLSDIPEFSGKSYYVLNKNIPYFSDGKVERKYYEDYSPLDNLGRCTVAEACLGKETMPREERGEIGQVKPSGWKTVKYDCVDGKYLYNRCHLIGFQLSGENANERNLITGTRYMNVQGMLPFENMVADYIKETGNHVLYRVTPIYKGNELVARGVQMEAYSVEDNGAGICFNVYCYNNQPGVRIDYATGDSEAFNDGIKPSSSKSDKNQNNKDAQKQTYIINTKTNKIHRPDCSAIKSMKGTNKEEFYGTKEELMNKGYTRCKTCNP